MLSFPLRFSPCFYQDGRWMYGCGLGLQNFIVVREGLSDKYRPLYCPLGLWSPRQGSLQAWTPEHWPNVAVGPHGDCGLSYVLLAYSPGVWPLLIFNW